MSVAVVTIAHGRHDHLARQVQSLRAGTRAPDHVVVAMGDPAIASLDGPHVVPLDADPAALRLAAARNLGASVALERGAEVLVFLDVDCLAGPDLVAGYDDVARAHRDHVWSGPVTYLPPGLTAEQLARVELLDDPHPARPAPAPGEVVEGADLELFWSLSFALHRDAWERSGGFWEEYAGYGGEDTDFAQRAATQGLGFGWVGDARAYHQHHATSEPPVQHVDDILRNGAIFHRRWGWWPMRGWLEGFEELGLVERRGDQWVATDRH
jgi:GT2 family glycosyltransferase